MRWTGPWVPEVLGDRVPPGDGARGEEGPIGPVRSANLSSGGLKRGCEIAAGAPRCGVDLRRRHGTRRGGDEASATSGARTASLFPGHGGGSPGAVRCDGLAMFCMSGTTPPTGGGLRRSGKRPGSAGELFFLRMQLLLTLAIGTRYTAGEDLPPLAGALDAQSRSERREVEICSKLGTVATSLRWTASRNMRICTVFEREIQRAGNGTDMQSSAGLCGTRREVLMIPPFSSRYVHQLIGNERRSGIEPKKKSSVVPTRRQKAT